MPTGKLASRQKLFAIWRCVFVLAAQAVDVSRGNQLRYDGLASAPCQDCEKRVRIAFAGPIAEGRFDGETLNVTAAKNDFQRGVLLLREFADTPGEREAIGDFLHAQTENLVRQHWKHINQLAAELVANGETCSEQIEAILGPRRMEFERIATHAC